MTNADIRKITLLEQNNKQLEEQIKELGIVQDMDEETKNKIQSLNEQIGANNLEVERLTEQLKKEIEEQVKHFDWASKMIENHLERIKAIFILESGIEKLNVNDELKKLTEELDELSSDAQKLVDEMRDFKNMTGREDFNLTPKEIKAKVQEFKYRLRDLKIKQIENYNRRVEDINSIIKEHKASVPVDSEAFEMVNSLEFLPLCNGVSIRDWRSISYKDEIKYSLVLETVNKIREIEEKLERDDSLESLEGKFAFVNAKVLQLEFDIESMDYASVALVSKKIVDISELLLAFGCRLEKHRSEMSSQEYEKYNNQYRDLMQTYISVQKKFRNVEKGISNNEMVNYDVLSSKIEFIGLEVNDFDFSIDSLFGLVVQNSLSVFENRYKTLDEKVSDFNKVLEDAYKNGILDNNQYENLNKKVNQLDDKLSNVNSKLKNPKMFNVTDVTAVYGFLNGGIDGVETALNNLKNEIDRLNSSVLDKETRKNIDAIFKKLESELRLLEKQLEMYKDKDSIQYEATKERLDAIKKEMGVISKKYRKCCPLLVKQVKSAKSLLKKYKKPLLISAGLAGFAMLSNSIIIPSIMYGNIMMAKGAPIFRGPIKTINNLLGGLIGATKDSSGLWHLTNGVMLDHTTAATSLLKGLAVSGVGNALLLSPVIVSVKKLVEKMNMVELKQKLSEGKEKIASDAKNGIQTVKDKIHTGKESVISGVHKVKIQAEKFVDDSKLKMTDSQTKKDCLIYIDKLIDEYLESKKSVDEFSEERKLDSFDVTILAEFEQNRKSVRK